MKTFGKKKASFGPISSRHAKRRNLLKSSTPYCPISVLNWMDRLHLHFNQAMNTLSSLQQLQLEIKGVPFRSK